MKLIAALILTVFASECFGQLPVVPGQTTSSSSSVLPTANTILWADSVSGSTFRNSAGSTSPSSGDHIEAYSDISGNHFDLTNAVNSSTQGPTYSPSATPNGKPALNFGGFGLSNAFGAITLNQPITIYMVTKYVNSGANQEEFDSFNPTTREVYFFNTGGGGTFNIFAGTSVQDGFFDGIHYFVVTYQFNGASSLVRTNGVVQVSGINPGTGGLNGFILGNRYDEANPTSSIDAAVVINNALDSTSIMHGIEVFLGGEYGVTVH